jgi:hypothetical protein
MTEYSGAATENGGHWYMGLGRLVFFEQEIGILFGLYVLTVRKRRIEINESQVPAIIVNKFCICGAFICLMV